MSFPSLLQVAIAADQFLNTLIGGFADETLSSVAHRQRLKGRPLAATVIDALFFWQEGHCRDAWLSEKERKQLPKEFR